MRNARLQLKAVLEISGELRKREGAAELPHFSFAGLRELIAIGSG
jgi:hypothetical protein